MNSDHAPTAEEQLPPLAIVYTEEMRESQTARYGAILKEREAQLLAALREIEKARGDVEGLRKILQSTEDAWRSQEKLLAEKDARIAELEKARSLAEEAKDYYWKLLYGPDPASIISRAEAAEAKLRAVSDALGEASRGANVVSVRWMIIKPLLARIRAIVEGK